MARVFSRVTPDYLLNPTVPVAAYPYSAAGWFYPTSDNHMNLFSMADSATTNFYQIVQFRQTTGFLRIVARGAGGSTFAETTNTATLDAWNHFLVTAASATRRYVYLNGDTANRGFDNTNEPFAAEIDRTGVGVAATSALSSPMDGRLAEIAVWDTPISYDLSLGLEDAARVGPLASGFSPRFESPKSLKFYLPMRRDFDVDEVGGMIFTKTGSPSVGGHPPVYYPTKPLMMTPGLGVGGAPADRDADPFYPFGVGPQFDGAKYPPFYRLCG